jgi:hypothetical protein
MAATPSCDIFLWRYGFPLRTALTERKANYKDCHTLPALHVLNASDSRLQSPPTVIATRLLYEGQEDVYVFWI